MFVFWLPEETHWLVPTMNVYYIQLFSIYILTAFQLIYLIIKLWKYENVDRKIKVEWTWLFLFFTSITSLIFIWKKIDEFENSNNQT